MRRSVSIFLFVTCISISWTQVTLPGAIGIGSTGHDAGNVILHSPDNRHIIVAGFFRERADADPAGNSRYLVSKGSEDIFVASYGEGIRLDWAVSWGGKFPDRCNQACTDKDGNIYLIGTFRDTVEFGSTEKRKIGFGTNDIFIAKIRPDGTAGWVRQIGGSQDDQGKSISVDAKGRLYVTGTFQGAIQFEDAPSLGLTAIKNNDVFAACIDTSGGFLWSRALGGINDDQANSIAADEDGFLYLCGTFNSDVDFDPGVSVHRALQKGVYPNMYVLCLNTGGDFIWVKTFGGDNILIPYHCRTDRRHQPVITGTFRSRVDFDPDSSIAEMTAPGTVGDAFLLKLHRDGSLDWARQLGGNLNEIGLSVDLDASNNILSTGCFEDMADFDPGPGTFLLRTDGRSDNNDIYISKLSETGEFLSAYPLNGPGEDIGFSVSAGTGGDLAVTGIFSNRLTVISNAKDSLFLQSNGFTDALVLRLPESTLDAVSVEMPALLIYPNPAHRQIILETGDGIPEDAQIEIFNQQGVELLHDPQVGIMKKFDKLILDTSHLPRGIFFIRLRTASKAYTAKLLLE